MDSPGIPFGLLLLVLIVIPIGIAVLLGTRAFRDMTPLVFRCSRCDREFRRAPHRHFPSTCPCCRARDWNA